MEQVVLNGDTARIGAFTHNKVHLLRHAVAKLIAAKSIPLSYDGDKITEQDPLDIIEEKDTDKFLDENLAPEDWFKLISDSLIFEKDGKPIMIDEDGKKVRRVITSDEYLSKEFEEVSEEIKKKLRDSLTYTEISKLVVKYYKAALMDLRQSIEFARQSLKIAESQK